MKDQRVIHVQTQNQRGLSFRVWPAASALCRILEDDPHDLLSSTRSSLRAMLPSFPDNKSIDSPSHPLKNLRVIELGAGPGLTGLFTTKMGAFTVSTDLPCALQNLFSTITLNLLDPKDPLSSEVPDHSVTVADPESEGSICVRQLCWGQELIPSLVDLSFPLFDQLLQNHEDPTIAHQIPKFDLIIATDCIYRQELFEPLLDALLRVSSLPYRAPPADGAPVKLAYKPLVLIANVKRRKIEKRFWKRAEKFFRVKVVEEYQVFDHEEGGMKPMRILSASSKT